MSGPSRELPPLVVKILGDNSDALAAMKGVVNAAKATARTIIGVARKQRQGVDAEFQREFTNYRLLQKAKQLEAERQFKNHALLQKAAERNTREENRKTQAALRGEHKKTVSFYRNSSRALNRDDGARNYGRLTPAFKGMSSGNTTAKGSDLNALVKNAEKTAKEVTSAADRIMAKADRVRASSVIASRNALKKQAAAVRKEEEKAVAEKLRRDKQLDKSAKKSREDEDRAGKKKWQMYGRDAAQNIKNDAKDAASTRRRYVVGLRASGAQLRQNMKNDEAAIKSTQAAAEKKARTIQGIKDYFTKAHKERLQQLGRELTQQAKNDAADIRARRARERAQARAGRQGGGGGLGNRADVYMHSGALRSISGGIETVLKPWAQLESHIATVKIFTGSIESARAVTAEMQKFALYSPYTLDSVMDATGLLLKFGQTSEDAMDTVKRLGDVAGGSSDRLKHVALGVAQAVSLGRLQGQELRQMTEGGFNPLRIAAEHATGIGVKQKYTDDEEKAIKAKMAYFDELMRKRKLDAKFVTAALKLTTSKGGRHAGAVEEQSKTPIGLATQIMESFALIAIEAVTLFDTELRAMLTTVLHTITKFIQWMKTNKDLVASIAITVAYVVGAAIVFHSLGLVVAWTGWVFKTVALIYGAVAIGARVLIVVIQGLALAFTATGRAALLAGAQMAIAWIIGLGPIAWVIAGVTALMLAIWYLRSQNGLVGMFQDAMWWGGALIGFFTNFSHNMQNIFAFIGANWHLLLMDMILMASPLVTMFEWFTGMDVRASLTGVEKGAKDSGYDTSMLKLDGPNLNPLSFLDSVAMPDSGIKIPEKPDINFEDYISAGKGGASGNQGKVEQAREHAAVGSNEQAQRTYEYSQAMLGSTGATTKDNAPMKQVALLEQLVRNTQPDDSRGNSMEDAGFE